MNYINEMGWYYIDANDKSPSWTDVEFLYNFLILNTGVGPKGKIVNIEELEIGDVIQLNFNGTRFAHSLIVVKNGTTVNNTLIAAHTYDAFGKSVGEYGFEKYRCIHIKYP